jgi:hypothetical protein
LDRSLIGEKLSLLLIKPTRPKINATVIFTPSQNTRALYAITLSKHFATQLTDILTVSCVVACVKAVSIKELRGQSPHSSAIGYRQLMI